MSLIRVELFGETIANSTYELLNEPGSSLETSQNGRIVTSERERGEAAFGVRFSTDQIEAANV